MTVARRGATVVGAVLTLGVAALVTAAIHPAPAAAHVCGLPVQSEVGQPVVLTVGVPVEATLPRLTGVDIGVPASFRVTGADPSGSWTAEITDDRIRYRGGAAVPGTCLFFIVRGVATSRETLSLPITLVLADGTSVTSGDPDAPVELRPALLFAGTDPAGSASDGPPVVMLALIVAGTLVLGAGGVVAFRVAMARDRDGVA